MLMTLIKRQIAEIFAFLFLDAKTGKKRSTGSMLLYLLLLVYAFGAFGFIFYSFSATLYVPFHELGIGWLYGGMVGLMATALGIFGSAFTAANKLYMCKDNDLLLSLPIPPAAVVLSRIAGLYLSSWFFSFLVLAPAAVVVTVFGGWTPFEIAAWVLAALLIPILSVGISCLLGLGIAALSPYVKKKSIVTVILTLAFIGGYYYLYSRAGVYLQALITNADAAAKKVKSFGYLFYQLGRGMEGEAVPFAVFAAVALAVGGLIFVLLSHTFLKISTNKRGSKKAKGMLKMPKEKSVRHALLGREAGRFFAISSYMINTGLGTPILVIAAIALIYLRGRILPYALLIETVCPFSLIIGLAVMTIASMNGVTSPSISLESKTLAILRSLPVSGNEVLLAKEALHILVTMPAAILFTAVSSVLFDVVWHDCLLLCLLAVAYPVLTGFIGLFFDLSHPTFNWSNEVVAVKQGLSVLLTMLTNLGITLVPVLLYIFIPTLPATLFIGATAGVITVAAIGMGYYIFTAGGKKFETLE